MCQIESHPPGKKIDNGEIEHEQEQKPVATNRIKPLRQTSMNNSYQNAVTHPSLLFSSQNWRNLTQECFIC